MPFLTHDLPPGGRPIAPPPATPEASALTRLRQLLPVGLLVAATGAAAATAPMIDGSASADGRHPATGSARTADGSRITSTSATPQAVTPGAQLAPAAYMLPQRRHRAALTTAPAPAPVTGGRHRCEVVRSHQHTTRAASSDAAPAATVTSSAAAPASSPTASAGTAGGVVAGAVGAVGAVTGVVGGLLGGD